ncbi:hypothetical protein SADUNF_Sadunf05G0004100 [Salix dunnii]|uniref:Glucose-6-phosphate dehydrogenase C-terminal domain-containing protein n=1 Tax=Salix dunnii TaxID=1413687 RepID=A0A835K627_9ROSI|nr:hypothetical protein SADUNF_Sadunf05G0004100 [Salix dunnii]
MSLFFPTLSVPSWDSSTSRIISPCSSSLKDPPSSLQINEILHYKEVKASDVLTKETKRTSEPEDSHSGQVIIRFQGLACSWMLLSSIFSIMTEPDSYEHHLLDFIDGDNHLFMRSDELVTAWNILTPTLHEVEVQLEHNIFMHNIRFSGLVDLLR